MKVYVIERIVKRKWHPLSFISKAATSYDEVLGNIGTAWHNIPTMNQSRKVIERVLEIVIDEFPNDKFRISEYERSEL